MKGIRNMMTHSNVQTAPSRLADSCPSWCIAPHKASDAVDDQEHYSEHVSVPLTLAAPVECLVGPGGSFVTTAPDMRIRLVQHVNEREPHVEGAVGDNAEWPMTLGEFAQMIGGAVALLSQARVCPFPAVVSA